MTAPTATDLAAVLAAARAALADFREQLQNTRAEASRFRFQAAGYAEKAKAIELPRQERERAAEQARWCRETAWTLTNLARAQQVVLDRVTTQLDALEGGEEPNFSC